MHNIPARSDEDWLRGVGTPLRVQFAEWNDGSGILEELVATYRDYNLAHHDSMVTVYDGIPEILRTVRANGYRTALVTSKNRQGALRGLDLTGLTPYIEVLVCADDVVHPKPHPEPVLKALQLLGAGPERAVFFGDSVHDMNWDGGGRARRRRCCGDHLAGPTWKRRSPTTGSRSPGISSPSSGPEQQLGDGGLRWQLLQDEGEVEGLVVQLVIPARRPTMPAGLQLDLEQQRVRVGLEYPHRATYFADSQYGTWLSLNELRTRIVGYACALMLSYGEYATM